MRCCSRRPSSSLRNAVRIIGILDLTFVTIPLLFEAVNWGYIFGFLDPFGNLEKDCQDPSEDRCSWTFSFFRNFTASISDSYNDTKDTFLIKGVSMKGSTYSVFLLILFILIGGIVEAYLVGMLRRGVREEVHHWCKKWFWIRALLLPLVAIAPILKAIRAHYNPIIDGLYDLTKVYRLITLVIVRCYMSELEITVGVVYIRPQRKPKKGSLGQDIHLLD